MLIKCKLKRQGGTLVESLFGINYHFKPDPRVEDSDHVCDVEDPAAIHRLLAIKEAYAPVDPDEAIPAKPAAPAQTIMPGQKEPAKEPDEPIIISDGAQEYNLTDMELDQLQMLARDTFRIKVHHKWQKEKIIAAIIEATRAE